MEENYNIRSLLVRISAIFSGVQKVKIAGYVKSISI